MPEMPERTKSKTRKVLSAVGRPVRGVGRRLGFKRNHSNHFGVIGTNAHLPNANSDAESDSTDTSGLVIRKSTSSCTGILTRRFTASNPPPNSYAWIVFILEGRLRYLLLIGAAYLFGTYSNQYAWLVQKLLEYTAVAWVTSIFILVIGDYYHRKSLEEQDQEPDKLPAAIKSPVDNGETPDTTLDLEAPESEPIPFMPHPALENFFVIDCGPMQRIIPNTNTSYKLETDYFTGEMMLLVRTPDCDDPSAASTPETLATSNYLRDKQRRFEFQFQIRLKKVPTGRVYFACELSEPVKMGIIQRAFVGAAMAFIKTTNNNFHYSLQGASSSDNEKEEKPHMAFPVEEGMNRVVMTPLGEPVPKLGEEIVEDLELYKQRRKGLQIDWKLDHIYTLSLWSAYVDFLDWRCINLPGIRPFQLSNVIGLQPITLTLYEIPEERGTEKHYKQDMKQIVEIEMCNSAESGLGPAANQWMQQQQGCSLLARRESELDLPVFITSQFSEDQANEKLVEEKIAEEEDVAELGEGIYVRSGDAVNLREVVLNQEMDDPSDFITYAAECVVLQDASSSSSPATITIVKIAKARSKAVGSPLIKNGDTVIFKLHFHGRHDGKSKSNGNETRYLTVHKGWWLKWSHLSKSAYFVVQTCDDFGDQDGDEMRSNDTQSSLLTFGGTFRIVSKKWPKYQVGVAPTGSARYGGRLLGLYSPHSGQHMKPDGCDDLEEEYLGDDLPLGKSGWLRPLLFRASEPIPTLPAVAQGTAELLAEGSTHGDYSWLNFSSEGYRMDVPAWVEMMNRSDRVRQLSYVIRVSPQDGSLNQNDKEGTFREPFVRLRTGRELSQVMRAGLTWRNRVSSARKVNMITETQTQKDETSSPRLDRSIISFDDARISFDGSFNEADEAESAQFSVSVGEGESSAEWIPDSDDEDEAIGDGNEQSDLQAGSNRVKRTAQLVGKLSKQTGKTVVATGKSAVRQSVRVGKGTIDASVKVTKGTVHAGAKVGKSAVRAGVKMTRGTVSVSKKAGKAIIAPRSKKPPSKEPKFSSSKADNGLSDLHLATKKSDSLFSVNDFPNMIAGELSGPEQSCRTVSNMLTKMSSVPADSSYASNFNALLTLQVRQQSDQSDLFLTGGAVQIGAKPKPARNGGNVYDSLIARCLWESHWREELCRLSDNGLAFYAPLTDTSCLELPIEDIDAVRLLEPSFLTPLPGYPILAIDTAWTCHYMAFANNESRHMFQLKLSEALANFSLHPSSKSTKELAQARFWQGFQDSVEASLSLGRGKWAEIASGSRMKPRTILNNRKMAFDLPVIDGEPEHFVEDLLTSSLSFSLDHLKQHPEDLVTFLDLTSQLRNLNLADMDLSTTSALCILVNIYHCLLQHALLLSLNGPLTKRSYGHFLRTSCYEIGKDVFSLAELHTCVIRGSMSRPTTTKFPAVDPPRKSESYRFYALGQTTPRINFLLNTGDGACTRAVPVLVPSLLDIQLNNQAAEYLRQNIRVDPVKRTIFLPKVCDIYRNDFASSDTAGAAVDILKYCMPFLDDQMASAIEQLESDRDAALAIKFCAPSESFYSALTEFVEDCSGSVLNE